MSLTMTHDARKRQATKRKKAAEIKAQAQANMLKTVKVEAVKMAEQAYKTYGLPSELESVEFNELPLSRRISILEDYIDQLRKLGARLSKDYGAIPGAKEELEDITNRIDAAAGLIVRIELENVKPKVPVVE